MSKVAGKFYARVIGSGPSLILIIARKPIVLENQPGVHLLIEPGAKDEFVEWLRGEMVEDAAKQLGISRSMAARLRKAFGLAALYNGGSRTSRWRRAKAEEADDQNDAIII